MISLHQPQSQSKPKENHIYNRAARIIEEMEEKGIISAPNSQGKREIIGQDN